MNQSKEKNYCNHLLGMRSVFIANSSVTLVCKAIHVAIGVIFFAELIFYFGVDLKKKSTPPEKNPLVKNHFCAKYFHVPITSFCWSKG